MVYDCPPDLMPQIVMYASGSLTGTDAVGKTLSINGQSDQKSGYQRNELLGKNSGSVLIGFETAPGSVAETSHAIEDRRPVEAAIANAAERTGVDFNYLLAQAEVESAMDPDARARTSSATGLYQFIDGTWLDTVKKHGQRFGLAALADEIALTASGSAYVADPGQRQAILALRNHPQVASLMAAGLAQDNRSFLASILGRQPSHAELYLAHFLGAGGAGRFLLEMQTNPSQSAPALFARPAAANRAIFYSANGSPRSLAQVMDVIGGKLNRALDRASGGKPMRFARAEYIADTSVRAPYLIADEAVFGPGRYPALTVSGQASPAHVSMKM